MNNLKTFKVGDYVEVIEEHDGCELKKGQRGTVVKFTGVYYRVQSFDGPETSLYFPSQLKAVDRFGYSFTGAELGYPSERPRTTLPTDSLERKNYPMMSGCLNYFPAALAGVAKTSKVGNDKHNPGQPLHHARGKSTDHGDCIVRHLTDTEGLLAEMNRQGNVTPEQVLLEANQLVWRALAYSQELHEKFGAPLAPAAKN